MMEKKRAPLNRTLILSESEIKKYSKRVIKLDRKVGITDVLGSTIHRRTYFS